ncbi:hypothetical protein NQ317_012803 [Molorchus minor]|uniref:Uncharacterized protein n=1 Tax=Molorchus minor TaxID=1323400 RepID=A0ABQ9K522_9CUCU|nr:hypothetical protein NQ317_012803 [Molorchus minor]
MVPSALPLTDCSIHSRSIMSGDSPNSHQNDIFDFKEGRTSPAPTTSKDIGIQSGEVVQASVLVEPTKEDESKDLNSPILNNGANEDRSSCEQDQTVQLDDLSYNGKGKGDKDDQERRKLNGEFDKLDGAWVPRNDIKKNNKTEDDDDNCTVKCLYYTMQCCECSIM